MTIAEEGEREFQKIHHFSGWTLTHRLIEVMKLNLFHIITKILQDTGIRKIATEGKTQRSHIMGNHGFRKFFETNAFKAGMDNMYLRRLMGQKSGLEDAYLKLSEEELLEGDSKHVWVM